MHTINLCNFELSEYSGNALNTIIEHYKFNNFVTIFLLFNKIYLILSAILKLIASSISMVKMEYNS